MTRFTHRRLWSLFTLTAPSLLAIALLVSCQNVIVAVGAGGGNSGNGETSSFTISGTSSVAVNGVGTGVNAATTGTECVAMNVGELATVSSVASSGSGNQCVAKVQDANQVVYEADCDAEMCDCLIADSVSCACDNTGNSDCTTVCCPTPWGFQ